MAGSKPGAGASTVAATGGVERVEIVTRSEARRSYTPEEKARLLTEAAVPGARVLLVAQRRGVSQGNRLNVCSCCLAEDGFEIGGIPGGGLSADLEAAVVLGASDE